METFHSLVTSPKIIAMDTMTLLLTVLTVGISFYYLYYIFLDRKFERIKIPHVPPIPIFGNMLPFLLRRVDMMTLTDKLYWLFSDSKYFGFYHFTKPVIVIRDPELIVAITIKQFDNFCDHEGFVIEELDPLVSKNLFNLRGDHWREMRKLLSPSFTSSKMKMMFGLMCQCADNCSNFLVSDSKAGKIYELKNLLYRYANDVIATCAFGINLDSFKNPNNDFLVLGKNNFDFSEKLSFRFMLNMGFPKLAKFLKLRMFSTKIENFFKDLVINTVKIRDEKGIVRPDMIQLMMETRNKKEGPAFDIDEMSAQALVFFIAGFDTVTTSMCFLMHMIGVNPHVQNKLRAEVDDVFKKTNGQPTYEAINSMKYLDAVMNETFRLYPIAFFLNRMCIKETELPPATKGGEPIKIKPGEVVWIPTFSVHRDPKYYEDPDKFNPDRFLDANVDTTTFFPFGIGPRVCIGNRFAMMEIKIMIFYLLYRCYIEPCAKTNVLMKFDKKKFSILPEGGFWLKIRPRESTTSMS